MYESMMSLFSIMGSIHQKVQEHEEKKRAQLSQEKAGGAGLRGARGAAPYRGMSAGICDRMCSGVLFYDEPDLCGTGDGTYGKQRRAGAGKPVYLFSGSAEGRRRGCI